MENFAVTLAKTVQNTKPVQNCTGFIFGTVYDLAQVSYFAQLRLCTGFIYCTVYDFHTLLGFIFCAVYDFA